MKILPSMLFPSGQTIPTHCGKTCAKLRLSIPGAVFLENEYLKCTILPDLGGHIYTCLDKVNGTPMFYANPSFKKALIAYRGAWSTFGAEFNFPVSHNWVTLSPVDFAYSNAADGSASVTVGNRDRVYGMEWTVEIVLHPGSTVLEERVTLSNRSDIRHRFYWWNNTAIEVWNDSKIWYPMQFTTEVDTWPVDSKGKDLSVIGNHTDGAVSRFAYGTHESFMGIYNPHTDAGVVHYADHRDLQGMKIWTWGVNWAGLEWRKTLSDNNSAYAEMQSGLFKDQDTYGFLEPSQAIHFFEFWMPVRGIGAISRANLHGVVSMVRTPQPDGTVTLAVGFNANDATPGAKIEVLDGEKSVYEETASLDPATTWTHRLANLPPDRKYTFVLKNDRGESLLTHTEDTYDVVPRDQVKIGPPPPAYKVADKKFWRDRDFLFDGATLEFRGKPLDAWDSYQAGLDVSSSNFELLKSAGRLAVGLYRYEDAAKYLAKAEKRDGSDAEVHYYRGVAEAALGHTDEARAELEAAHRSPSFGAAGGLLLAELLAQGHASADALKVLKESCPDTSLDLRCFEETVALERSTGDVAGAKKLGEESLRRFPTSLFLRNELAKLGTPSPEIDHRLAADSSRVLNLVMQYNRLGLYSDSLELLSRSYPHVAPEESDPGAVLPADDPVLAYYRGFCRQKLGQSGQADFDAASHMPLRYVFPNEADTIPVLRAAIAANPSDASAHFLLGSLWFSKGLVDPAIEEWKRADSLNPKIATLDASLGRVLLQMKKRPEEAAAAFQRGMQVDPTNPALYVQLSLAMRQMLKSPAQRADMLKRFPDTANMPVDVLNALVNVLREGGKDDEAKAVIAAHFAPRKE
jgi:tetratricopeptide (TPR) repeat protein